MYTVLILIKRMEKNIENALFSDKDRIARNMKQCLLFFPHSHTVSISYVDVWFLFVLPLQVLKLLPDSIPLHTIREFLMTILKEKTLT